MLLELCPFARLFVLLVLKYCFIGIYCQQMAKQGKAVICKKKKKKHHYIVYIY